jgi:hypothetical protein
MNTGQQEQIIVEYVRVSKTGNPKEDRKIAQFSDAREANEWVNVFKMFDRETTYTGFSIKSLA